MASRGWWLGKWGGEGQGDPFSCMDQSVLKTAQHAADSYVLYSVLRVSNKGVLCSVSTQEKSKTRQVLIIMMTGTRTLLQEGHACDSDGGDGSMGAYLSPVTASCVQ